MALEFLSRRSPVLGRRGMVASSQPLASAAGLRILQQGGNAADAAVAMAACLNVTEPCSTGIGGDAFALFYKASEPSVSCVLGNGRSPAGLTMDLVREKGFKNALPPFSALTVTVPGAAAAWVDIVEKFGTLSMDKVLAPAIELAEGGYPVSPLTAEYWSEGVAQLLAGGKNAGAMLVDNRRAPTAGEIMTMPLLAKTFRLVAEKGIAGFYQGPVAEAIVAAVMSKGGVLSLDDLAAHETRFEGAISTTYKDIVVWEVPPPTHGITALLGLNYIQACGGLAEYDVNSAERLHVSIEAMRLAFADSLQHVADPHCVHCPVDGLLTQEHAKARAACINMQKSVKVEPSVPPGTHDTVYLCVVDGEGNACSMINSNYMGFGTGIIPDGCGFTLQNRGHNFSLEPNHPNCLGPRKRPYHTIIPGLATYPPQGGAKVGPLYCAFGVMGGFMQPQGHVQVMCNLLDYGMDPQEALDFPRFCLAGLPGPSHTPEAVEQSMLFLEAHEGAETKAEKLRQLGHQVEIVQGLERAVFGRGQIIRRDQETGVCWGGSDPRADGCAMGW